MCMRITQSPPYEIQLTPMEYEQTAARDLFPLLVTPLMFSLSSVWGVADPIKLLVLELGPSTVTEGFASGMDSRTALRYQHL